MPGFLGGLAIFTGRNKGGQNTLVFRNSFRRIGGPVSLGLHVVVIGFFVGQSFLLESPDNFEELEKNSITLDALSASQLEAILRELRGRRPVARITPAKVKKKAPEPIPAAVKREPEIRKPKPEVEEKETVKVDRFDDDVKELLVVEAPPEPEQEPEAEETDDLPDLAAVETPPEEEQEAETSPPPEPEPEVEAPLPEVEVLGADQVTEEQLKELELLAKKAAEREATQKDFSAFLGKIKINVAEVLRNNSETEKPRLGARTGYSNVLKVIADNGKLFSSGRRRVHYKIRKMSTAMERAYLGLVDQQLRQLWHLPLEMDRNLTVLVRAVVARNGSLVKYEFVKMSDNEFLNNSVRNIFKNLKKLAPLPEKFSGRFTEVGLKFRP